MKKKNSLLFVVACLLLLPKFLFYGPRLYHETLMILQVASIVSWILVLIAIRREKADVFAWVAIGIHAVLGISIQMAVLVALMLVRKFVPNKKFIANLWMLPAVLAIVFNIAQIQTFSHFLGYRMNEYILFSMISLFAGILEYAVLGFWLIKRGVDNSAAKVQAGNDKMSKQIAYYEELYAQGAITEQELNNMKAQIQSTFQQ